MMRLRAGAAQAMAAVALAALSAAGCGIVGASATPGIGGGPTGKPITIGISLPLTGDFAADGVACEKGYQLWVSDVNNHNGLLGRPVKLIIRDDRSNEFTVRADYRVFIQQDHVDLVLAPFSSLLTIDAAEVTDKAGYPLPAGSAGSPHVYELKMNTIFSTNVPVQVQMVPFANWVAGLSGSARPTTAAYPMVDDPFADPPVQDTQLRLEKLGIKTLYSNVITAPEKGSPAQIAAGLKTRLKAAADRIAQLDPQLVVLGSVDVPTVATFMREFIAKRYSPKIIIAAAGPDQGEAFLQSVGVGNAVGVMVPNGWYANYANALSHVMVQDYIAQYGGTGASINADVAESYSAGQVLEAAVRGTGSLDRPGLIAYLHSHTVQTVIGPVRFNSVGENINALKSAFIFQWQPHGQFVQVLGPGAKPGAIITTKPPWAG